MEGEQLEAVFERFFARTAMEAHAIIWILANKEMTTQMVERFISPFRNSALKKEFLERTFNFGLYRLASSPEADGELGEAAAQNEGFISELRERLNCILEGAEEGGSNWLCTGILKEVRRSVKELKLEWLQRQQNCQLGVDISKTQYAILLIEKIFEVFYKDGGEGVAEKITSWGGIEPVIVHPIFSQDLNFREKFKKILYNCSTFREIRRFSGKDFQLMRKELTQAINQCLLQLDFDEHAAEEICAELIANPLSNVVATRRDLTNAQKEAYYQSAFYKSKALNKFLQVVKYEDSLEFRAKEDITKMLTAVEEQATVKKPMLDCLLTYNLIDLLKIATLRYFKRGLFSFVIKQCPNFLKAFKLTQFLKLDPAVLRQNEDANVKFQLIEVFKTIQLPFEQWQEAQANIMSRKYNTIDELLLKPKEKQTLFTHIFSNVEPYFHRQDRLINYQSQVFVALLEMLMNSEIGENASMESILTMVNESLAGPNYRSPQITNFAIRQQRIYTDIVDKNCALFKEYQTNKGKDVKEEQYKLIWELKEKICTNNFEDNLYVSYDSIQQFIQKVVQNGGSIPQSYPRFITDLNKLRGDPIPPVVQVNLVNKLNINNEKKQELSNDEFKSKATDFVRGYISRNEDSMLEKIWKGKYTEDSVVLVSTIISEKAFENPESKFFNSLGFNGYLTKKIKAEFAMNAESALETLKTLA